MYNKLKVLDEEINRAENEGKSRSATFDIIEFKCLNILIMNLAPIPLPPSSPSSQCYQNDINHLSVSCNHVSAAISLFS